MRFVAIDFETATQHADSPCQLAAVVVEHGAIVAEHCWLIRPPGLRFNEFNVRLHGISPDQVADQPNWRQRWPEVWSILEGWPVLAHNAPFDLGVLRASLARYRLACPRIEFNCTRLIASRTWPGRPSYALKAVAQQLDLQFRHHDALEDARVCARIALSAAERTETNSLAALEQQLRLERGWCDGGQCQHARRLGREFESGGDLPGRSENRWPRPFRMPRNG
jgi:DNA polymerase-3 subunit epsilon